MKQRMVVASEALQGKNPTMEDYAELDNAVVTSVGYMDLMKAYFGFAPVDPSFSMMGAFRGSWGRGAFDEGEFHVQNLMRKALTHPDTLVLELVINSWAQYLPRSCSEIVNLATRGVLEKLEIQSNALAHKLSEEQLRDREPAYRVAVERTFTPLVTSRVQQMKAAMNKAEENNATG
ncbi:hypothetical protein DL93DRAFT_2088980 [Clavulina sp. PMI_390]|nr:hypothetical protein DL93DRAFT_2088980 [Clavulina sp. PMI_390]